MTIQAGCIMQTAAWRILRLADGVTLMSGTETNVTVGYCGPRGEVLQFGVYHPNGFCNGNFAVTVGSAVVASGTVLGTSASASFGWVGVPYMANGGIATYQGRIDIPAGSPSQAVTLAVAASNTFGSTTASLPLSYVCGTTPSVSPSPSAPIVSPSPSPSPSLATYLSVVSSSTYASIASTASLRFGRLTSFSVALHLRAPSWSGTPAFVGTTAGVTGKAAGFVLVGSTNGAVALYVGDGSVGVSVTSPVAINDSAWHHVAFTVSRTATTVTTLTLYVDGVFAASGSSTTLGSVSNSNPLNVGQDGSHTASAATGASIDELRVWNVALSASTIAGLAVPVCVAGEQATSALPSSSNLLVRLSFSEGTSTSTANTGTLGGVATLTSTTLWASSMLTCSVIAPAQSSFVQFVGYQNYVTVAKASPLVFGASTSFTVALYFRASFTSGYAALIADKCVLANGIRRSSFASTCGLRLILSWVLRLLCVLPIARDVHARTHCQWSCAHVLGMPV